MFHFGEKKRQRLLHNARCRRYYQRHLSKKAREKREREANRQLRLKAEKQALQRKEDSKPMDTSQYLL